MRIVVLKHALSSCPSQVCPPHPPYEERIGTKGDGANWGPRSRGLGAQMFNGGLVLSAIEYFCPVPVVPELYTLRMNERRVRQCSLGVFVIPSPKGRRRVRGRFGRVCVFEGRCFGINENGRRVPSVFVYPMSAGVRGGKIARGSSRHAALSVFSMSCCLSASRCARAASSASARASCISSSARERVSSAFAMRAFTSSSSSSVSSAVISA